MRRRQGAIARPTKLARRYQGVALAIVAPAAIALLASGGCRKHAALPPQCEAELALMRCVAEHMTPGPTRPNLNAMRAELERDLEVKGAAALDARCRVDTDSLRLTSGAMCATAP